MNKSPVPLSKEALSEGGKASQAKISKEELVARLQAGQKRRREKIKRAFKLLEQVEADAEIDPLE